MKLEFQTEAVKASPAIVGTAYSAITLNQMVAILTILYVLMQMAYLVWKWRREAKGSADGTEIP